MPISDFAFLGFFAFCAGLIDSVVGGGGLIQIPALFNAFPNALPATIFGTNKIAGMSGAFSAAWSYVRRVKLPWALIIPAMVAAFVMAFTGAAIVSLIPKAIMQPVVFVLLTVMAIYTFHKKEFGLLHTPSVIGWREKFMGILAGGAIGFYDGAFGPGTGSFLIFLFIRLFSFDFLHASAASKLVNVATNAAALLYFIPTGHVLWQIALIMALCNVVGSLTGTRLALKHGAGFVRGLFLVLLVGLIGKMGWGIYIRGV